ncbi:flagellar basal body rod protein FlgC [Desulfococcus sp.]|uniref:flagellar basal body rod protein FlgC n=1 Tax=Desulfococcus sp. TaxID=2025834 RepID=UPI003593FA00
MNFLENLNISASALTAQRTRMNIISANLANINTTRTAEGGPYRRKDVVFAAGPPAPSFQNELESKLSETSGMVEVSEIVEDPRPPILKYAPEHPDADASGYIRTPNINLVEEMVNLIAASRSYEASLTAVDATKKMSLKALEIGR